MIGRMPFLVDWLVELLEDDKVVSMVVVSAASWYDARVEAVRLSEDVDRWPSDPLSRSIRCVPRHEVGHGKKRSR